MRIYTVSFNGVAVTAVQDLFEILMPSDMVGELHRVQVTQFTEEGDAQDEQLQVSVRRVTGAPSSGSGGSTPTPTPLNSGDVASGVTAEVNNTTQLSGGTNTVIHAEGFNIRNGFDYFPPPEHRPRFAPSTRMLVELEEAPADSVSMCGTLTFAEID